MIWIFVRFLLWVSIFTADNPSFFIRVTRVLHLLTSEVVGEVITPDLEMERLCHIGTELVLAA